MAERARMRCRLPTDTTPAHYDLTVRTDLSEAKFDGTVVIQCVPSTRNQIRLSDLLMPAYIVYERLEQ